MRPLARAGVAARAALGVASLAASVSCGGGPTRTALPTPTRHTPTRVLGEQELREVLDHVAAARQLPAHRPIRARRVDRATFRALLREGFAEANDEQTLSPTTALLLGFNLVPPPQRRGALANATEVLEEEVVGFYDSEKDTMFVPLVPIASDKDAITQRAVVAHEAEHALQHQNFGARNQACERDACLAELALWEGDAMVAMGAYLGAERGEPVGRTLRRIADVTREVSLDHLTSERGTRAIDRAAPVTRREIEFPYVEGMLFASDLYRAGGFPLVDAAFRSPPTSTMHVLHPDKYLAGIEPRMFADVPPPRGRRRVASGAMGEMMTRLLLEQCTDRARAERASAGWAGDRYSVFVDGARTLSFGWVTAWDTSENAEAFERALREGAGCFEPNRLGRSDGDYAIGADLRVSRRGDLVAALRNVDAASIASLERALFASEAARPQAKPRSSARVPPRISLPAPRPGHLEGDTYVNDWLGLAARVPPGMRPKVGDGGMDLVIGRSDVVVHGGVALSTRVATREQNERTFEEVYEGFRSALAKEGVDVPLSVRSSGPTRTPLGDGVERTWRAGDTPLELRMVLIPICATTGSIVFVEMYADGYARTVLDGWIGSFRFKNGRNLEACAYLDPK